mmetsp:Transcript_17116/g.36961  ORF Transcript_17116/g.36961 Transcript_17116/m.36961 type:complete len:355 (+) Transcript_17116:160-1224(+)|eukprot:CAMPEP_0202920936 /NCGR_PEP_ID=MMETSP1392-20130828/77122_1 /ASSEMBLY_ACC=CAM_ASM_000868 /TAXON_ID=225041 /ORGANISM="Chlamydomonas chlamydogama, Strain SAG 11-48b" /LENGTH=354 /DNA_ID=CAMNT_0049614461 /DNA_START=151 /DNA_END=1215 /DNA_ORIENTATION=+
MKADAIQRLGRTQASARTPGISNRQVARVRNVQVLATYSPYQPPPKYSTGRSPNQNAFPIPLPFPTQAPREAAPVDGIFKATGKTVVITGGSQGIGRATALLFARKGYNVVVAARDLTRLQYVAHDCAQVAGRQGASLAVQCDVTNEREVRDLANLVVAKFEDVDVVVNNAGVMAWGSFADTPAAEARKLMEVNYMGPYHVSQAFLPVLVREAQRKRHLDRPSLIMVNSFAGKVPLKQMAAFTASKYALEGLTYAVRAEVAPQGIHVAQVHPGLVKTNLMERAQFFGKEHQDDRKSFRQQLRALPLSQTPQEVADAIYNAAQTKQEDIVVGLPFAAAAEAFRFTGVNVTALPFM